MSAATEGPPRRADALHFYAKTCAVVSQARATHLAALDDLPLSPSSAAAASTSSVSAAASPAPGSRRASTAGKEKGKRVNKWFNLELPDTDLFRTELKTWRNLSRLLPSPPSPSSSFSRSSSSSASSAPAPSVPPMVLDVILDTSDLTPNQVLVLSDQRGKRLRVPVPARAPTPPGPGRASPLPRSGGRSPLPGARGGPSSAPSVVLERWVLSLRPTATGASSASAAELPTVYKHAILHFRALFTLVRALPAYALHRKLARRRAGGLKVGVRMGMGTQEGEGEVDVEEALEGGGAETERIEFPGVETPLGTLSLTLTYRLNTDFSVEEIETLLSSRFIDEDFFRPTVARYRTEPGSLPLTSTSPPVRASPPAAAPAGGVRGMTGLAPLPSYGSLSSRHQYAPAHPPPPPSAPSPLSRSPHAALPAPVPLVPATLPHASPAPSPRPGTSASPSTRFAPYAPAAPAAPASAAAAPSTSATGAGAGAGVEPAFISLSRARGASFTTAPAGGGVQRASPLSASPSGAAIIPRRTSLTSSSGGGGGGGGSPIFRPGSYLGMGASSSSSPSYAHGHGHAPAGRQQPLPLSGSPLAGGGASPRPLGPVSYGSQQGSYTRSGILRSSAGSGSGSAGADEPAPPLGIGIGISGAAGAGGLARRPSGGAPRGLSFGVAGSLGRASPSTSGPGGPSRLGTMMAQYDAAGLPSPSLAPSPAPPAQERRRFVNEGRAPDDADEISAFLGLLDAKPDLRASEAALGRSGGGAGVVSKRDVDEQLRMLRSSVFGLAGSGESPSPPGPVPGLFGGVSPSPRSVSALSGLRRQTSRLSIEEDPAAEAAARSPSAERPPALAAEKTPRAPYRPLAATKRELASPALSATSAGTAIPPLSPSPAPAPAPSLALGVEPRFLPLPLSSTTSPLASPGVHAHPHTHYAAYPFAAAAALERQPYPPLPYPPAEGTGGPSEPVTIAAPRPSAPGAAGYLSRAARQPLAPPAGFASATASEQTSAAGSIASFDVDAAGGSGSYAGEEEAVGRLELDDSPAAMEDEEAERERRGRWGADEEEVGALALAQHARHSRDATPAAVRLGGGAGGGYFAQRHRSGSRDGEGGEEASPPEISWMG
ncbi:autophagy protein 13 [Rhodotorula kratochvilovae]